MGNKWEKFKLLMWKNWVLQKRHKKRMIIEILCPIVFFSFVLIIRGTTDLEPVSTVKYEGFNLTNILFDGQSFLRCEKNTKLKLSYSPKHPTNKFDPARQVIMGALKYLAVENIPGVMEAINTNNTAMLIGLLSCVPNVTDIMRNDMRQNTIPDSVIEMFVDIKGYSDARALEKQLTDPLLNDTSVCGIQFEDTLAGVQNFNEWPKNTKLTLRFPGALRAVNNPLITYTWATDMAFPPMLAPGPRLIDNKYGGYPGYMQEGFMPLAHALFHDITEKISGNKNQPNIWMSRFPHPEFMNDVFSSMMKSVFAIFVLLSFNYICCNTIRAITYEKEKQLKEVMKIMGLPNWLHWTAWFTKTFIYLFISLIMIILLISIKWFKMNEEPFVSYAVFTYTPWHMLFFFMVIYLMTSICFCFMISTFFSKATTAAGIGGLAWFLSFLPYSFFSTSEDSIPSTVSRIFSCLVSNTAMAFGFEIIFDYEATTEGMQWSKLFTPITVDDTFVMGHVILMLILDAVLYLLIALYVEQVFPGSYGIPEPWYFPFSRKFWKGVCGCNGTIETSSENFTTEPYDRESEEPDPKGLRVGIEISNLSKTFKQKVAVNKLNLRIFEDQITILLGHNGAGKTTTMSMLTGMLPPTSGTATVAGYDIRKEVDRVRSSLGLCPQHNVLFSDLTVGEHIYFYSRLKGLSGDRIQSEIDKYTNLLGLQNKRDVFASELSGGMQRRLSIGTALCGDSKVVLLDEPSSGMDPSARREMWDLLHLEKKGRTLILTTHFMDEAEILGERVAILSDGKLRCVGSPFFLKKKFGIGYRLTAARQPTFHGMAPPTAPITNLLTKHVPSAKLYTDIGSEISYILPDENTAQFKPMLKELEENQETLGLMGFGISASTLEEVFMRVGADVNKYNQDEESPATNDKEKIPAMRSERQFALSDSPLVLYTGWRLTLNQMKAMFFKRFVVMWRSWLTHLMQILVPIGFITITVLSMQTLSNITEPPPRVLELSNGYKDTVTTLNQQINLADQQIKNNYKSYFATSKLVDIGTKDMIDDYLKKAKDNMANMRTKNLFGATMGDTSVTGWFSNFAYHDLPVSVMLLENSILQVKKSNFTYTLVNHPLPRTVESQFQINTMSVMFLAMNITISMAFVAGFFLFFYVKENVTKSKLLQMASGVSPLTFWNTTLICDMCWMAVVSIVLCCNLAILQQQGLATFLEIARIFLILMMFGWMILPITYLFSSLFASPSSGFNKMLLVYTLTGVGLFITVFLLEFQFKDTAAILNGIFLIFPHYNLAAAMNQVTSTAIAIETCNNICSTTGLNCTIEALCNIFDYCCIANNPYFNWKRPGIGANLTYMGVLGIVLIIALLFKEYEIQYWFMKPSRKMPPPINPADEDTDVAAERERIKSVPVENYKNYNLLCKDMSKYYKKFLAVDQLTLGVKDGECFGLLGVNGAGKTTTFKMLTGDLRASCGEAWVKGYSINKQMKKVHENIGYCPQFDALLDDMTGKETLQMYSLLRGIPANRMNELIAGLAEKLGFTKHLDKEVGQYSGGNKRKLSTSIALLGNPQVIYLDEPTTGMDPAAKRLVWNAISECSCVILTSHSMEECEALCTRLTIMVNGRPQCLGSPQHLKNKFSQGYTLIVKLKRIPMMDDEIDTETDNARSRVPFSDKKAKRNNMVVTNKMFDFYNLHDFLLSKFADAELVESYQGVVTYHLPSLAVKWSTIFGIMEAAKDQLNIEDYSIGQTSLEQIFLKFTSFQIATGVDN